MKTISASNIGRLLVALALAGMGNLAFAAWNLNMVGTCTQSNVASETCATTGTGAGTATLSGWSTGSGTGYTANSAGSNYAAAAIYNYGSPNGLGIVALNESSSQTGPHAFDNAFGVDAMIVGFSTQVSLSSLVIGWNGTDNPTVTNSVNYNDSDLSIFHWAGTGAPSAPASSPSSMPGTTSTGGALSAGWVLVGNYADVGASNGNTAGGSLSNIANNTFSSYWLISAYSTSYGSTCANCTSGQTLQAGSGVADAFKLMSVAGGTCTGTVSATNSCGTGSKVPEPGSMALMGAALAGLLAVRRRKGQVS